MERKENTERFPAFQQRFYQLRQELKMSQADFANHLGIARATVGFYEKGDRLPDALVLKQIAEKCQVSADYLLGLHEAKQPEKEDVRKRTGLSVKATEALERMQAEPDLFHREKSAVNFLLENYCQTDLLRNLYKYFLLEMFFLDMSEMEEKGFFESSRNRWKDATLFTSVPVATISHDSCGGYLMKREELNDIFLIQVQRDLMKLREITQKKEEEGENNGNDSKKG